jgi:hypothetical protein
MDIAKRVCSKCNIKKDKEGFHASMWKRPLKNKIVCKVCHNKETLERYHRKIKDPEWRAKRKLQTVKAEKKYREQGKKTAAQRKRRYGIDKEAWDAMYLEQQGCCKICGKAVASNSIHTDHCHKTGTVRGLLCQKCNMGIGMLNDNPTVLRNAAEYLEGSCYYG